MSLLQKCDSKLHILGIPAKKVTENEYNNFIFDIIQKTCDVFFKAYDKIFEQFEKKIFGVPLWVPGCPQKLSYKLETKKTFVKHMQLETLTTLKSKSYLIAGELFSQVEIE